MEEEDATADSCAGAGVTAKLEETLRGTVAGIPALLSPRPTTDSSGDDASARRSAASSAVAIRSRSGVGRGVDLAFLGPSPATPSRPSYLAGARGGAENDSND